MRHQKAFKVAFLFCLLTVQEAFSYGLGISSWPFREGEKYFTTEFTGNISSDGGVGVQARYTHRINRTFSLESGLGFSNGKRANRFFASADMELFPDFKRQPRIGTKFTFETAKEFGTRRNIVSAVPMISKGLDIWNQRAYPFIGIPVGLALDQDSKEYNMRTSISFGMMGKLPFKKLKKLLVHLEGNIGLMNSYTGVLLGMTFPLHNELD